MSRRRPVAALAALVALAGVAAGCAPEYALYPRLRQHKSGLGPIEIISVACFVPGGRGVDSLRSRELAQTMLRRGVQGLARKGYVAANDSGPAIPCFVDAQTRYLIGVPSGTGFFSPEAVNAGGSCIAGDTTLAEPQRADALRRLLGALRLPGDNAQLPDDSLRQAIVFHRATGFERVLVIETYVRTVPRGRQIAEGVVSGVLTLGHALMWEHPWTIVNVYLIDCSSGNVLWYDAGMLEAGGEPGALATLMATLVERLP
jgi:hypothetical protein